MPLEAEAEHGRGGEESGLALGARKPTMATS